MQNPQPSIRPMAPLRGEDTAAAGHNPAAKPMRSAWRPALIFVAVAAVFFGAVACMNYRLNPLSFSAAEQSAVAATLARGRNVALADPNIDWRDLRSEHVKAMKETPDVVLFGGSRWQEATSAVAPGKRFYNAFVNNDHFEDVVALTGLLYATGRLPRTFILSVRFFSFDYLDRHDSAWWKHFSPEYRAMSERLGIPAHSWSDTVTPMKYSTLLSIEALVDRLARRRAHAGAWQATDQLSDAELNVVGADGALRFSAQHLMALTPERVEKDALESAALNRNRRLRIDRSLLGQLGTLVKFLNKQGVQVVLVQTPVHPAYFKAIQGTPYYDDVLQIENDTRRIAAEAGALVGGGFDSAAFGCTAADYRDFNHASDRCLSRVLRAIPGLE